MLELKVSLDDILDVKVLDQPIRTLHLVSASGNIRHFHLKPVSYLAPVFTRISSRANFPKFYLTKYQQTKPMGSLLLVFETIVGKGFRKASCGNHVIRH